jgi:hypothetical protein
MKTLMMLLSLLSMGSLAHAGREIAVHLKPQDASSADGQFHVTVKPFGTMDVDADCENHGTELTSDQPQIVKGIKNKVIISLLYSTRGQIIGRSVVRKVDPSTTELHVNPAIIETIKNGTTYSMIVVDIQEKEEKAIALLSSLVAMISSYLR